MVSPAAGLCTTIASAHLAQRYFASGILMQNVLPGSRTSS
jgi:hypothetical protein